MKGSFDLLVFDWDGTLVDSIGWIVHCIQHAARYCQCDVPSAEASKKVIGLGLNEALETLFPGATSVTRQRLILSYRQLYGSRRLNRGDLFSGVLEMLQTFKEEGYYLAIATGKSRSGLQKALQTTGMTGIFDAYRCADDAASKPDPMMLLQLLDELDIPKERSLMIGDSLHDLQMARNAEIASVAVACGAVDESLLSRKEPLFCLQRTADLRDALARISQECHEKALSEQ